MTRELSVDFGKFGTPRGGGFMLVCEEFAPLKLPIVKVNPGFPFFRLLVPAYASVARRIVALAGAIAVVLRRGGEPQIVDSIVRPASIYVVERAGRPDAINEKPRDLMRIVVLWLRKLNLGVPATMRTGDGSGITRIPTLRLARMRTPRKNSRIRIIRETIANEFNRQWRLEWNGHFNFSVRHILADVHLIRAMAEVNRKRRD